MALAKDFLSNRISDLNISRSKLIIGISLGVIAAFSLYVLFNVSMDAIRLLHFDDEIDPMKYTGKEQFFYNLFYGYISSIFGQTMSINYLLHHAKPVFKKRRYRLVDIQNHHNFYTWNTLHWLIRMASSYGLFYLMFFSEFALFPDYIFLFVLLIIVIFLGSWNTTILIFKRQAYKILLISGLFISCLSLMLSQVQVFTLFPFEQMILKQNIHYHYKYEKASSDVYYRLEKRDLVENIYMVFPKHGKNREAVIVHNNKEKSIHDISNLIDSTKNNRDEVDRKFLTYNLCIDKEVPMVLVNQLKYEIVKTESYKLAYAVTPIDRKNEIDMANNCSLPFKTPPIKLDTMRFPMPRSAYEFIKEPEFFEKNYIIHQLNEKYCQVNDSMITYDELTKFIKPIIASGNRHVFVLDINKNLSFASYFKVISSHRRACIELMDEFALSKYGKTYYSLCGSEARDVNEKIKGPFIEIYPELMSHLIEEGYLSQKDIEKYGLMSNEKK